MVEEVRRTVALLIRFSLVLFLNPGKANIKYVSVPGSSPWNPSHAPSQARVLDAMYLEMLLGEGQAGKALCWWQDPHKQIYSARAQWSHWCCLCSYWALWKPVHDLCGQSLYMCLCLLGIHLQPHYWLDLSMTCFPLTLSRPYKGKCPTTLQCTPRHMCHILHPSLFLTRESFLLDLPQTSSPFKWFFFLE